MYGNYFHCDVSSSWRNAAAAVLLLVVLCEFQVLSKYTIYRSNCGRNTAVTIQQTTDVRTKKTLQLLPTRKAVKCAILKSGKSHFCWRKTDPCDITSWRGFNSLLVGCDAVSVREWFPTFQKTILLSSSKASSQIHSERRRHIPTTSNLALLKSVVILDAFACHDPCNHLCNYTGRKATPIIVST
jgi:hypothetical protein